MSQEKRGSFRIPVTVKVALVKDGVEEIYFTENLSSGGFQMKIEDPPFVGTKFKASISLPQVEDFVEAKCEVMWRQQGQGCGVQFKSLTKANRDLLERFLEESSED